MPNTERPRRKTPVDHDPAALKAARIRCGWRQGALAQQVGMSWSTLSEAESGTRGLNPEVRLRIAEVLNCDPITFEPLLAAGRRTVA